MSQGGLSQSLRFGVKALTFDVFGTVVDYRRSITALGRAITARTGVPVDWAALADAWRGEYRPGMDAAMAPGSEWVDVDEIYRRALRRLAPSFGLQALPPEDFEELAGVWSRLTPWGDSVPGLQRLRGRFILAALSNGNLRMLVDMARHAGLPWDLVLSAEMCGAYKPDPRPYRMALGLLRLRPDELLMVAAHAAELRAVQQLGIRTALVIRPLEHGPGVDVDLGGTFDVVANDLTDLADQLGV
jgi:2-haloacid dehalogenase